MVTVKYAKQPEADLLVSYDTNKNTWKIIDREEYLDNEQAMDLFDECRIGTSYDERERYIALVNDHGKKNELIIICDRQEVIRRTYELNFITLQQKHKTLFFDRRIRLDDEYKLEQFIDNDETATIDVNVLHAKIATENPTGKIPAFNYSAEKGLYVYYSNYDEGPFITFEELKAILEQDNDNIPILTLRGDIRTNFRIIYVFESELIHAKVYFVKHNHHLIFEKTFDQLPEAEEYFEFLEIQKLEPQNILVLEAEEYADHLKKLEASNSSKKDSSSVTPGNRSSNQKSELEDEIIFDKEAVIDSLRQGKIVQIICDLLEKKEKYQVRSTTNEEYESIRLAVEQGRAQPIEVFIVDGLIFIIDGYTRAEAAREMGITLKAILSPAKNHQEASARAYMINASRSGFNPLEEAHFFRNYKEEFKIELDKDLAAAVGKSKTFIHRRLKLANLSLDLIRLLETKTITIKQAEALGSITIHSQQEAYENDWFDNEGKMTRNHPEGTIKVVSISYTEETHAAKRGLIPHFKYVLELSNKKTKEVYSRTNTDFAKMLKKGEVISEDEDTLEILCKPMTDTLKMSKRVLVGWPISAELNKQTDLEITPEDDSLKIIKAKSVDDIFVHPPDGHIVKLTLTINSKEYDVFIPELPYDNLAYLIDLINTSELSIGPHSIFMKSHDIQFSLMREDHIRLFFSKSPTASHPSPYWEKSVDSGFILPELSDIINGREFDPSLFKRLDFTLINRHLLRVVIYPQEHKNEECRFTIHHDEDQKGDYTGNTLFYAVGFPSMDKALTHYKRSFYPFEIEINTFAVAIEFIEVVSSYKGTDIASYEISFNTGRKITTYSMGNENYGKEVMADLKPNNHKVEFDLNEVQLVQDNEIPIVFYRNTKEVKEIIRLCAPKEKEKEPKPPSPVIDDLKPLDETDEKTFHLQAGKYQTEKAKQAQFNAFDAVAYLNSLIIATGQLDSKELDDLLVALSKDFNAFNVKIAGILKRKYPDALGSDVK